MFTPSVVLLVIANTVAATGAVLVALQARMFETGRAALPSLTEDAARIANADFSWQQGEVADAARPEEPRSRLQFSEGNLSFD
jgi:hypothetical protein